MTDSQIFQGYLDQIAAGAFLKSGSAAGEVPMRTYAIDTPLTLAFKSQVECAGFELPGVTLISTITGGAPLLKVTVAPGLYVRGCHLSGIKAMGGGSEGHALTIDCSGGAAVSGDFYRFLISQWMIEGFGGDGVNVVGNVFEGTFEHMFPAGCRGNGMTLGSGANGGILSSIKLSHGSYGNNMGNGLELTNGANDVEVRGIYFLLNGLAGVHCPNGLKLMQGGGFENNRTLTADPVTKAVLPPGPAISGQNYGTFDCVTEGGNNNRQTSLMDGFYTVGQLTLRDVRPAHGIGHVRGAGQLMMRGCSGGVQTDPTVRLI